MELHISIFKDIYGKPVMADMEMDTEQIDELPRSEQRDVLLEAYEAVKEGLNRKENKMACDRILRMPFPEIPDIEPAKKKKK